MKSFNSNPFTQQLNVLGDRKECFPFWNGLESTDHVTKIYDNWSKMLKKHLSTCHKRSLCQAFFLSFYLLSFPLSHPSFFSTVSLYISGTSRWKGRGWNLISMLLQKPHPKFLNQATSSIHRQYETVLQLLPDAETRTHHRSCPPRNVNVLSCWTLTMLTSL